MPSVGASRTVLGKKLLLMVVVVSAVFTTGVKLEPESIEDFESVVRNAGYR